MKESKHLLALIYQFLIRKEELEEKKELLDWYENYNLDYEPTQEHIARTGSSVKRQVLYSMQQQETAVSKHRKLWYSIAAAAAIFLVAGSAYWFVERDQPVTADSELLSSINPSAPQAKITLENGDVIDLEKMSVDSCIQVGSIEIRKDITGQITYVQNNGSNTSTGSNSIETPPNANYTLNLSDGTVVILNANTKLKYPNSFGNGDRIVELEGEAYFIVAKTKNKQKFFVKTAQQTTEVLGTKFNVKARKENSFEQTTLEEGLIQVVHSNTMEKRMIQPGQQATLLASKLNIEPVDLEPFLTWTEGYFYLDGQNTPEVLQEIAAWYNIDIDYSNTKNSNTYKGKISKKLPLDKLIQLLVHTDLKTKPIVQNDRVKLLIL